MLHTCWYSRALHCSATHCRGNTLQHVLHTCWYLSSDLPGRNLANPAGIEKIKLKNVTKLGNPLVLQLSLTLSYCPKLFLIFTGHHTFSRHAWPPRAAADGVDWTLVRSPMEEFFQIRPNPSFGTPEGSLSSGVRNTLANMCPCFTGKLRALFSMALVLTGKFHLRAQMLFNSAWICSFRQPSRCPYLCTPFFTGKCHSRHPGLWGEARHQGKSLSRACYSQDQIPQRLDAALWRPS